MTRPLHIWIVGDGKPGHVNQSLGLAEALGRRLPVEIERIDIPSKRSLFARIRSLNEAIAGKAPPALVVGAGHRTHLSLIWIKRKLKAPSVVLMRPSLPTALFDLCLVPRHDLGHTTAPANVVATIGALNRVIAGPRKDATGRLILVGGPSAQHGWEPASLTREIREITAAPDQHTWEIADSRRSPDGFLSSLAEAIPGLKIHPHRDTAPDWLARHLAGAAEVWVTEDSVSMVYEALTAGARVGVLPAPRLRAKSRVVRGLEMLAADAYVTLYQDWLEQRTLRPPPTRLAEADRCAQILLDRLFPTASPASTP